jgi:diaminohydroxyphosphoribosylaminopyrimidine deaminase/5-amino-6-(5-phosphoribosylamino)uracil reductase
MNHKTYQPYPDPSGMYRCLQLAKNGLGRVAPNPMVGCVIKKDDRIIAEGFHQNFGGPHAEVEAINRVPESIDFAECALYVNLEPCSHQGKTPPCADLIIEKGFRKVVVAMEDPHDKVAGKGIARLREAGIDVEVGVLAKEAEFLNRRFIAFHKEQRPYIILKWAQSADGLMDRNRNTGDKPDINWISQPETKKLVHLWRSRESAIMVGAKTVWNDNPTLTVREVDGKNPLRVVLSTNGELPATSKLLTDGLPTLIFNQSISKKEGQAEWTKIGSENVLIKLNRELKNRDIQSVFVEGGRETLQFFIDQNAWDEMRVIKSDIHLQEGLEAPEISGLHPTDRFEYGRDQISIYHNQ